MAFSLGRIFSYIILSLVSAAFGQYLVREFYESRPGLMIYLAAGIFITLLGVILVIGKIPHLPCPFFKKIGSRGIKEIALLGLVVGFAPCLPLLGVLTYIAFNAQNLPQAALLGLTFGLGTVISPLILFGPLAGEAASFLLKKPQVDRIFSRICGLVLVYLGIGMIVRMWSAI